LAGTILLCIALVRFNADPQHQSSPQDVNAELEEVQLPPVEKGEAIVDTQIEENLSAEKEETLPNAQIGEYLTGEKEASLSYNQNGENQSEEVEKELQNSTPPELLAREDLNIEPEYVDDTDIDQSIESMEVELTDLLFHYDVSDEKIDEIFDAIRAGTEEDINALDPSYDYSDRVRTIVRLIEQSDMNFEQITIMINDIFPR